MASIYIHTNIEIRDHPFKSTIKKGYVVVVVHFKKTTKRNSEIFKIFTQNGQTLEQ